MAETLKDVINKLKAKKLEEEEVPEIKPKISKPSMPENRSLYFDEKEEEEESDEDKNDPNLMELKEDQRKEIEKKKQQIFMEIEMLQNNGRFRAELLSQFQEINRALVIIAGTLVDIYGKK